MAPSLKKWERAIYFLLLFPVFVPSFIFGQRDSKFEVAKLYSEGKLSAQNRAIQVEKEGTKTFIKAGGGIGESVIWLPVEEFKNGKLELVARGKDIHQGSFYGLAFHAQNDSTYDVVYCRPFNYRATDSLRKIHAIQYVSYPGFDWQKLRAEFNGKYEKGIANPPKADDWVTLTLQIEGETVSAYINHATEPSLVVKKLNQRTTGKIGITGFNCDIELVRMWPSEQSASVEADRYFTTSDGVRLHYRVSGSGTPLVIFPGYGQDASKFDNVYKALEKHFTIYCLDYRWLGKSDSPAHGYHIERLAKDAKEMIEDAKIDKFYLFGHSMGNAVAWCYFSIFGQDQVLKYILGDEAPCFISDPFWTDQEVETYTGSAQRRELYKVFRPATKPEKQSLQQDMMGRLLVDHLARDWRDAIPNIKIPTMIVMGGKSHFASPMLWTWLQENIKGSRLEIMKEAGHGFYESHPAEFNKLVLDFLKK